MIDRPRWARRSLVALVSIAMLAVPAVASAEGPYEFDPAAFDIDAAPDGSILVAENTTVMRIQDDTVETVVEIPTIPDSPVNGLAAVGTDAFFASSGGLDLAAGAGVWYVSNGTAPELVGDIEAFETDNDPDAFEGEQWKDQACEEDPSQGFTAGPQSNPYHLTARSSTEALVADAAGNTLLSANTSGAVDWVAVFTPPIDPNTDDYMVLFPLDADTDCYVQPVPTSVAIGSSGDYYVGELTGATPGNPEGLSRIWRIDGGSTNVTCPSANCEIVMDGFTSVIDVAFGPDGMLYVVEYDEGGWLNVVSGGTPEGGTISACDVTAGSCEVVASDLNLPSAITFDSSGELWLLESNIGTPTVQTLELPFPGGDEVFTDVSESNIFAEAIGWMADQGITKGCNPPDNDRFCPTESVDRGQMAAFIDRWLDLPDGSEDFFVDDDGSTFEAHINAIAEAEITLGCNPPDNTNYCPTSNVERGQMAAFVDRALNLPDTAEDFFVDDNGSIFEQHINNLAAAGITKGCNPPANDEFCPNNDISREQMAAFLFRARNLAG